MNNPNILLIDDDSAVASALSKALSGEGFAARHAADGGSGIAQFDTNQPDLVLLDLGLPDCDGWEVFEHLSRAAPEIPIVVFTARPGQYPLSRVAGVGALVEKPADIGRLLETMRRLLAESAQTRLERLVYGEPATELVRPSHGDTATSSGPR